MRRAVRRVKNLFYRRSQVILLRRPGSSETVPYPIDAEVSELAECDLGRLGGRQARLLRKELRQGARVFAFLERGHLAHYSCVRDGPQPMDEVEAVFEPPGGGIYIYRCFTAEACRGRGLYSAMLAHLRGAFPGREQYIAVERANAASRHVIEKSGFEEVGQVSYRRLLVFSRTCYTEGMGAMFTSRSRRAHAPGG